MAVDRESADENYVVPQFRTYAWDYFNQNEVLLLLTRKSEIYPEHRSLLLAVLFAYVLSPSSIKLIRQAIRVRARILLIKAERLAAGHDAAFEPVTAVHMRNSTLSAEFYEDFYLPIGGIDSLFRGINRKTLRSKLKDHIPSLNATILFVTVAQHCLVARTIKKRDKVIAQGDIAQLIDDCKLSRGEKLCGERVVKQYRRHAATAALIYAAATIETSDGTLLDQILKFRCNLNPLQLNNWLAKSHYIDKLLSSNLAYSYAPLENRVDFSKWGEIQFDPLPFEAKALECIWNYMN